MRLIQKAWSYFQIDVSIHASVKDATKKTYNRFITNDVSIHASVKDATLTKFRRIFKRAVSIHASVKDATITVLCGYQITISFNPRICKRCDFRLQLLRLVTQRFNPRICKRCDYLLHLFHLYEKVSIHASVKDATPLYFR